jgi:hypothetical protein
MNCIKNPASAGLYSLKSIAYTYMYINSNIWIIFYILTILKKCMKVAYAATKFIVKVTVGYSSAHSPFRNNGNLVRHIIIITAANYK